MRGIGNHRAMSLCRISLFVVAYLNSVNLEYFRCIQGFVIATLLTNSFDLNLQLRNHLKIESVAALPHSIRWSAISHSATSITTYKLDCSQATNSWVQPYKARILDFSIHPSWYACNAKQKRDGCGGIEVTRIELAISPNWRGLSS